MADRIFISELAQAESVNDDLMFVSDDGTQTSKVNASQIKDYVMDGINPDDFGSVKSVNDVLPDESGNITLTAEDIGITPATSSGGINPNLLDNWYFGNPVNQRGETEYTKAGYCIDRWYNRNCIVTLEENNIRLTTTADANRAFNQRFENYIEFLGKTVTVSALVEEDTTTTGFEIVLWGGNSVAYNSDDLSDMDYEKGIGLISRTFKVPDTINNTGINLGLLFNPNEAEGSSVVLKAIKVEFGSVQTLAHQENGVWVLNEIPNFAEELAKCQRYAVAYKTINTGFYWNCHAITDTQAYMTISLPQNIRALPTVTFDTSAFSLRAGSEPFAISGVSVYTSNANVVVLRINSTNFTVGSVYSLRGNATTYIVISADL